MKITEETLDVVTLLGQGLRREVPSGAAFIAWVQTNKGLVEYVDALYSAKPDYFTWPRAAQGISDLSSQAVELADHQIRLAYEAQGGQHWDRIESLRLSRLSDSARRGTLQQERRAEEVAA